MFQCVKALHGPCVQMDSPLGTTSPLTGIKQGPDDTVLHLTLSPEMQMEMQPVKPFQIPPQPHLWQ